LEKNSSFCQGEARRLDEGPRCQPEIREALLAKTEVFAKFRSSVYDLPLSSAAPPVQQRSREPLWRWKLVALEWERTGTEPGGNQAIWVEEIPYGLQISSNGMRLVENPNETKVIVAALDMIVQDSPLSRLAIELNREGYRTREGKEWTVTVLFNLLPRMIEVGPRIFSSEQWLARRARLPDSV
jgi:hypothetical protein